MKQRQGAPYPGLIEGEAGPFYVALNRAAFYLLTAVFAALVPLVAWILRDASMPIRAAVSAGCALEAGALAHIYVQRVLGRSAPAAWTAHALVAVLSGSALFAALVA